MATAKKKSAPASKRKKTASPASKTRDTATEFTASGLRRRKKRASRLTVADWVNAAIEILVTRSVEHVRVELIAVNLGATKGSFYWHFKDRAALLDAIIDEWKLRATTLVETWAKSGNADAKKQLQRLLEFDPADSRWADLELAMRAWSRRSPRVQAVAREVDKLRIEYLQGLFTDLGYDGDDALLRSIVFYGTTRSVTTASRIWQIKSVFRQRALELILAQ